jgi:hypothetical protein
MCQCRAVLLPASGPVLLHQGRWGPGLTGISQRDQPVVCVWGGGETDRQGAVIGHKCLGCTDTHWLMNHRWHLLYAWQWCTIPNAITVSIQGLLQHCRPQVWLQEELVCSEVGVHCLCARCAPVLSLHQAVWV